MKFNGAFKTVTNQKSIFLLAGPRSKTGQTTTTEGGNGLSPNIFRKKTPKKNSIGQNSLRKQYEKWHFHISIFFQFLHTWKRTTITLISSGFASRQKENAFLVCDSLNYDYIINNNDLAHFTRN